MFFLFVSCSHTHKCFLATTPKVPVICHNQNDDIRASIKERVCWHAGQKPLTACPGSLPIQVHSPLEPEACCSPSSSFSPYFSPHTPPFLNRPQTQCEPIERGQKKERSKWGAEGLCGCKEGFAALDLILTGASMEGGVRIRCAEKTGHLSSHRCGVGVEG